MASNELLNNLFEIAQSEVDEIIYFNDFSTELRNSFKELTNDEYDSALLAINEQIKNGNKLMEFSSGKMSISTSVISKATSTVEYQRQIKEHYQSNLQENKIDIENVIITSEIFSLMVKNYTNLSLDEKNALWDNYSNYTREEQRELENANIRTLENLRDRLEGTDLEKTAELAAEQAKNRQKQTDRFINGDSDSEIYYRKLLKNNKRFLKANPDINPDTIEITQELIESINIFDSKDDARFAELAERRANRGELSEEENEFLEQYDESKTMMNEVGIIENKKSITNKKIINNITNGIENSPPDVQEMFEGLSEESEYKLDNSTSTTGSRFTVEMASNVSQGKKVETQEPIQEDRKIISEKKTSEYKSEENAQDIVEQQFSEQDISEALSKYQEYFQDFDEEMIEAMSECTPEEIIANIKDDFDDKQNEGEITEETRRALDAMLESITNETKEILLDSQKREAFFEKIQSELMSQKDRGTITDSEIAEMFERASVDLEVAPFEPVREEDVMPPAFSIPDDNRTAIENTEVDGIYIENGVLMQLDKEYTEIAMEAQARGEDPEKALEEYITRKELEAKKESQEQTEEKAETEEEKADSIPEIVVVDETQESMEQKVSVDENIQMPEELLDGTQLSTDFDDRKQNENFVVMKKGKDGKIQVLRPMQFLKKSGVTLEQVEEEYTIFKEAVKETLREENEQSQNNENNMNLENDDVRE